jgi:hypothetical protein
MTDTATCFSLVRGRRMRVTKLDSCGRPQLGPTSQVVTDGFISVALTANVDAGTEISVSNAAGKVCVQSPAIPEFKNYAVAIDFCGVDPDLISLLTDNTRVIDLVTSKATGFRVDSAVDLTQVLVAIELWSEVPNNACDADQVAANFGYMLLPFVSGGTLGDFTVQNDAVNFSLANATTRDGAGWDVGPYNVVRAGGGAAAPLATPVTATTHLHVQLTDVAPPAVQCGSQMLGTPSTGAAQGAPATLSPSNSYPPTSFADTAGKTALIASPSTAWTTGNYVLLGDGSKMHWSGTAWVAGPA